MTKYNTKEELIQAARAAASDIDAAETKKELIAAFKKHVLYIGYKTLARLLVGQSPEEATKRWADRLGKEEDEP
ncbi:MAG TPA: hypothetical protein VL404_01680 [Candidatus Eisenbacteria bacterium]|nr:hypothetical protein [Candidatus Eisenbacteria bacterium]